MTTFAPFGIGPLDALLARLEGVRKCGGGYIAKCPAHADRSASLSVAEGREGRVLVKCFAGCEVASIVHAVGLELADLFPPKADDATPERREQAREAWRQSGWSAALGVLGREATVVAIAASEVAAGRVLPAEDLARLRVAIARIDGAREVLT